MYENARDVAEAALALVEMADAASYGDDAGQAKALEIAAAVLAVHVSDWHVRDYGHADVRTQMFSAFSSDWEALRLLSKGLKHPKSDVRGDPTVQRGAEWEDVDGWDVGDAKHTLFVDVDGTDRSVRVMTETFCRDYLERGSTIQPPNS